MPTRPLSQVLAALPEGAAMTLGTLLVATGSRAHGAALLLLALPEALPLPVPSASAILGMPLVLVSAHLALFGEAQRLPRRLREVGLPAWFLRLLHRRVAPLLARAERLSRPRYEGLAAQERLLGVVCLYLSALLLLPLPFFNIPPAVALVLLAWGMLRQDGAAVALGLAGTALTTALMVGLLDWIRQVLA